jgi:hypothetical protein
VEGFGLLPTNFWISEILVEGFGGGCSTKIPLFISFVRGKTSWCSNENKEILCFSRTEVWKSPYEAKKFLIFGGANR